jgi:hypothetical protein
MSGERDLVQLRRRMAPHLHPDTFVFCSFADFMIPAGLDPICTVREAEGITAIVEKQQAVRAGATGLFESRLITLTVHSSLDAVGFLACLATTLADADIPCNVVAGYHHDHLFVPVNRVDEAVQLLSAQADV